MNANVVDRAFHCELSVEDIFKPLATRMKLHNKTNNMSGFIR